MKHLQLARDYAEVAADEGAPRENAAHFTALGALHAQIALVEQTQRVGEALERIAKRFEDVSEATAPGTGSGFIRSWDYTP